MAGRHARGVTQATAQEAMTRAADSYAPLGVALTATYETVSLSGDDAQGLIDQAKTRFGGARPAGSDLVYVMTAKDIQADGNTGVAGLADCIGGVRFADRAFAVGEVFEEDVPIGPLSLYADATAKIAAHELGHLMGGHHHYANCAEGVKSEQEVLEGSPCPEGRRARDRAGGTRRARRGRARTRPRLSRRRRRTRTPPSRARR